MIYLICADSKKFDICGYQLFCVVLVKYLNSCLFGFLVGGWQDGATAVCVWVLGQTVSFLSLICYVNLF